VGKFESILQTHGVNVTWRQRNVDGTLTSKGTIKVIVEPSGVSELLLDAGVGEKRLQQIYTTSPLAHLDQLIIGAQTWECCPIQKFEAAGIGELYYTGMIRLVYG